MINIKKIVCDNVLDAQKYFKRGELDVIFVVGEKVMVKTKFLQTNLSKDLITHKLESENCGPSNITVIHGNNVTLDLEEREWLREEIAMPEPEVMDETSYEVESILKKQLNSRRERENATKKPLSQ
ncbi:hypothetical protein ACTFIW_010330 [Dictyostelium discoideum]